MRLPILRILSDSIYVYSDKGQLKVVTLLQFSEFVSDLLHGWATSEEGRPPTGSLVQLVTKDSKTQLICE